MKSARSYVTAALMIAVTFPALVSHSSKACAEEAPVATANLVNGRAGFLDAADTMRAVFLNDYAPRDWKASRFGLNVDKVYGQVYRNIRLMPDMSTNEFHAEIAQAIIGMKDYHVSISFTNTESARIPVSVFFTAGKYFVGFVDRSLLSQDAFPAEIGDEIIAFNGRDPNAVEYDVRGEVGHGNVLGTDRMLAARRFTARIAAVGMTVPLEKTAQLTIRHKSGAVKTYTLDWIYTEENSEEGALVGADEVSVRSIAARALAKKAIVGEVENNFHLQANESVAANPFVLGGRTSYVPVLGEMVWRTSAKSNFDAYVFKMADGRKAGYIRLNTYNYPEGVNYARVSSEFGLILNQLEKDTDSLVIDQINNPGGSVFYLYGLASMFANQPLRVPFHQEFLNPAELESERADAKMLAEIESDREAQKLFGASTLHGYPVTAAFAHGYADQLNARIVEAEAGKSMSSPLPMYGIVDLKAHAVYRYTKPVLLLTNELDFSGGDFFPAIMQDNKRAKILGARTAGAGGYIRENQFANRVGISSFVATGSIAWRPSGQPIENLGVTPDIPYEITADDMRNGFRGYKSAILSALDSLR